MSDEEFANAFVHVMPHENPFGNWTRNDVIRGILAGLRAGREQAAVIVEAFSEFDKTTGQRFAAKVVRQQIAAAIRGGGG